MSNNMHPLVTIAIPTYNRADGFLKQALQSAVDQTYPNIEIVVSDNCSTDDTEILVSRFCDERIRYFRHSQNIGANNNFNFCLEQAQSDYFLLLHDDDLIDHDFVDVCMKAANYDSDIGVILTGTCVVDENGTVLSETTNRLAGVSTKDFFLGWFSDKVPLYLCSTLYNTKRLKEIGGFKSKTNHFLDVVATVQLAAKHGRVDVLDVKAGFRRHSDNMGGASARINDWCEDSLYLLDIMCNLVSGNRTQIRRQGMPYFCRKNYRLAATIKSPIERLCTYFMIYKKFDYSYSPIDFLYSNDFKRLNSYLKRKVKQILFGT